MNTTSSTNSIHSLQCAARCSLKVAPALPSRYPLTKGAIVVLALLAAPYITLAFSVEHIIDTAHAGNGTVVESHSSANTGGQTAASGQTVTTSDSSASSHTETHINANGSGGTVEVKIQKTENGETTNEEYSKKVEPNEPVHVNVGVEASSDGEGETKVEVNGEAQAPVAETSVQSEIKTFFTASVPNFFRNIFSFVWLW